jgi:hypothetical protein
MLSRQSSTPDFRERGQRVEKVAKSRASRQVRAVYSSLPGKSPPGRNPRPALRAVACTFCLARSEPAHRKCTPLSHPQPASKPAVASKTA